MAGLHRLRQTLAGRDRHRAIQVHHRAASASPVVSCSANRSRHRLRRPQPNACVRTSEIRPPQGSYEIVIFLKDRLPLNAGSMHQRRLDRSLTVARDYLPRRHPKLGPTPDVNSHRDADLECVLLVEDTSQSSPRHPRSSSGGSATCTRQKAKGGLAAAFLV